MPVSQPSSSVAAAERIIEIAREIDRYAFAVEVVDGDAEEQYDLYVVSEPLRESLRQAIRSYVRRRDGRGRASQAAR